MLDTSGSAISNNTLSRNMSTRIPDGTVNRYAPKCDSFAHWSGLLCVRKMSTCTVASKPFRLRHYEHLMRDIHLNRNTARFPSMGLPPASCNVQYWQDLNLHTYGLLRQMPRSKLSQKKNRGNCLISPTRSMEPHVVHLTNKRQQHHQSSRRAQRKHLLAKSKSNKHWCNLLHFPSSHATSS